jgi:hypothetical protein
MRKRATDCLDINEVKDRLRYDRDSGLLYWVKPKSPRVKVGQVAGCLNKVDGYWCVSLNGKTQKAHILAWAMVHGEWPKHYIDHINGKRSDNRLCNLREATNSQNQQNKKRAMKNSKSGVLGVIWDKERSAFRAEIRLNGKGKFLGRFKTAEEASEVYLAYKRQLHEHCTI